MWREPFLQCTACFCFVFVVPTLLPGLFATPEQRQRQQQQNHSKTVRFVSFHGWPLDFLVMTSTDVKVMESLIHSCSRTLKNFVVAVLSCCSVMSDSLWPQELQPTRLPCPSPSPEVCSNSCPFCQWRHPALPVCLSGKHLKLYLFCCSPGRHLHHRAGTEPGPLHWHSRPLAPGPAGKSLVL